jgi:hypothetical protein
VTKHPSDSQWITIPNWEEFQHYKDRDPNWIKVYTRLLHDDAWLSLTDAQKGFLLTVWLEFASTDGHIRACRVPSRIRPANVQRTLEALSDAGFIALSASKPLAQSKRREYKALEKLGAKGTNPGHDESIEHQPEKPTNGSGNPETTPEERHQIAERIRRSFNVRSTD